jgi:hypothetical protein
LSRIRVQFVALDNPYTVVFPIIFVVVVMIVIGHWGLLHPAA